MTYYGLCGGVYINQLKNVQTHNVAIGKESAWMNLRIISADGGGSSIQELQINTNPLSIERVKVETLDSYALTSVCLIKIDVEGSELDVLMGAVETIRRCRPRLLFEAWPDEWFRASRERLLKYVTEELKYNVRGVGGVGNMYVGDPL